MQAPQGQYVVPTIAFEELTLSSGPPLGAGAFGTVSAKTLLVALAIYLSVCLSIYLLARLRA